MLTALARRSANIARTFFGRACLGGRNSRLGREQCKRTQAFPIAQQGGTGVEGYCVKCRAKKQIKDAKQVTMKNGRPATEGVCPDCNTKIFKIGKAS
jgi:hypothetical protein